MAKKKQLKMKEVGLQHLEQYNQLLRYVFQVTDRELQKIGWEEEEILKAKSPILEQADVLGCRIHGILGSIVTVLGTIIPPFVIISLISIFYNEFKNNQVIAIALQVMRAGVAAVILDVVFNLGKNVVKTKNVLYIIVMIAAFIATYLFNVGAMYIIFICLAIGLITVYFNCRKEKKDGTSVDSIR